MLTPSDGTRIFISVTPTDMRKSINGLSALVLDTFHQSPQSKHIFIFYNKIKDKVKLIFWDKNGFVLYYKRIEKRRFQLKFSPENDVLEITENQLQWLLAGLDFQLMHEFNEINYKEYY
jgi:transposase